VALKVLDEVDRDLATVQRDEEVLVRVGELALLIALAAVVSTISLLSVGLLVRRWRRSLQDAR
jgi:hypothetical protein